MTNPPPSGGGIFPANIEEEHYMKTQKPNCKTCLHMTLVEVAGDDRRMFCSSDATKLLPMQIGYITTGKEATYCGSYKEGKPWKENQLTVPDATLERRPAPNPTVYLLDDNQQGMAARDARKRR